MQTSEYQNLKALCKITLKSTGPVKCLFEESPPDERELVAPFLYMTCPIQCSTTRPISELLNYFEHCSYLYEQPTPQTTSS